MSNNDPNTQRIFVAFLISFLSLGRGYHMGSDMSSFIVEREARLWVHGHIHCCCDYAVGKTRVIANPRGYPTEPRTGFDPGLIVEV